MSRSREAFLADLRSNLSFWLEFGLDKDFGGILTSVSASGELLDSDKSVWFQGRAAWVFATCFAELEQDPRYLGAAVSCLKFLEDHCVDGETGKLFFSVARDGKPVRMRRYFFSEIFAAIGHAAVSRALSLQGPAHDQALSLFHKGKALSYYATFVTAKVAPKSFRVTRGLSPVMMKLAGAQDLRTCLGDVEVLGLPLSHHAMAACNEIKEFFWKPDLGVLLECVGPEGQVLSDHFDGRCLNPGHAIEAAWFILREAERLQGADRGGLVELGCAVLDAMFERGWDKRDGGILYFTDLLGKPVQEYWSTMKFWWPANEAVIAFLFAHRLTGREAYRTSLNLVLDWTDKHFVVRNSEKSHYEWYGYLNRSGEALYDDGLVGSSYKGPFHLPRMLLMAGQMF
jgi:N-acylglucosamine 2-epimerase